MLPAVKDYRELARRRLARFAFDYLEGGAEDGDALRRNRAAFDAVQLSPRVLTDVSEVDASVDIFGRRQAMPMLVGPTGLNGLFYPKADEILARSAHKTGVPFILSTASTSLIEEVRACTDGDLWLQLYVQRDRRIAEDMMRRASECGYSTLVLTVDTTVHGKRDHDLRNGFRLPITFSPRLVTDLMGHPRWCLRMLRQRGGPQLVNLARSAGASNLTEQATTLGRQMNLTLGWNDIRWLRHHWKGPVVVKGILSVEDAVQAHACGADGIVLSNHGGRQLGSAPSPLELLPRVIDAVRSAVAVFIDGGIRRGADIAKACAMGAKGALLGRAPLYGLAARGAPGVGEVLAILKEEFEITLRLLGQPRACKLDNSFLFPDFRERLQRI